MEENQPLFTLSLDDYAKTSLYATAKWAKFLAIVSMIVLILAFMGNILGLTIFNKFTDAADPSIASPIRQAQTAMLVGTLIVLAIAFFPLWYLYQFANKMKVAIAANDVQALNDSFFNLKRYFRFIGILVIILLSIYALLAIFALVVAGA